MCSFHGTRLFLFDMIHFFLWLVCDWFACFELNIFPLFLIIVYHIYGARWAVSNEINECHGMNTSSSDRLQKRFSCTYSTSNSKSVLINVKLLVDNSSMMNPMNGCWLFPPLSLGVLCINFNLHVYEPCFYNTILPYAECLPFCNVLFHCCTRHNISFL